MIRFLKIAAALMSLAAVSACGTGASSVSGCLQSNTAICAERLDLTGKEGATTYDVVTNNGAIVKMERTNETSTFGQDLGLTVVGAATGPLINAATAIRLQNGAPNCGEGCGPSSAVNVGETIVQVAVDTSSSSTAGSSGSQTGGRCGGCEMLD